jgi:hypothetical protein
MPIEAQIKIGLELGKVGGIIGRAQFNGDFGHLPRKVGDMCRKPLRGKSGHTPQADLLPGCRTITPHLAGGRHQHEQRIRHPPMIAHARLGEHKMAPSRRNKDTPRRCSSTRTCRLTTV